MHRNACQCSGMRSDAFQASDKYTIFGGRPVHWFDHQKLSVWFVFLAWIEGTLSTRMQLGFSHFLTRAPLGYFYNAPHWGGGGAISSPPSDLRNYWADSKNSNGIWNTWKNCRGKTNFIDLGVTSDVTGQVKVKMFDISGLVTSTSKIAMLSTNKAN